MGADAGSTTSGLTPQLPFFAQWAEVAGCSAEELCEGIASLLDSTRRAMIFLDREDHVFSRYWHESDRDIQRGYLPLLSGVPKGLKLQREPDDKSARVNQWLSERGDTTARQAARRWGIPNDEVDTFLAELWKLLTDDLNLLAPVTLVGSRGRPCRAVRAYDRSTATNSCWRRIRASIAATPAAGPTFGRRRNSPAWSGAARERSSSSRRTRRTTTSWSWTRTSP